MSDDATGSCVSGIRVRFEELGRSSCVPSRPDIFVSASASASACVSDSGSPVVGRADEEASLPASLSGSGLMGTKRLGDCALVGGAGESISRSLGLWMR